MSERPCVVVLGASNVARSASSIVQAARLAACRDGAGRTDRGARHRARPCDFFIALGHGRSYGTTSRFLGREIPGLLGCRLWESLDRYIAAGGWGPPSVESRGRDTGYNERVPVQPAPSDDREAGRFALVTDVGNDIAYEHEPELIASWVREAFVRLRDRGFRTVATTMPLEALRTLSERRFTTVRNFFFPRCTLTLREALARVERLDTRMREMAGECGVALVRQPAAWFGVDPIHVLRRHWPAAWAGMMLHWRAREARTDGAILLGENDAPGAIRVEPPDDELSTTAEAWSSNVGPCEPINLDADAPRARCDPLLWFALRTMVPDRRRVLGIEQRRAQPSRRLRDGSVIALF